MHTYAYIYMHACAYIHTYIHTCMHACMHIYTYIHACMHTYTYIYMHTYTGIHACMHASVGGGGGGGVADLFLYHPVNIHTFCPDVKMSHFIIFESYIL